MPRRCGSSPPQAHDIKDTKGIKMDKKNLPHDRTDTAERNRVMPGVLYLVATPIGNMSDITYRAVKVLAEVDIIAAEDTRNSGKLLSLLGISRPMISYHEHNKATRGPEIVERLQNGESCALITDAGTPGISDPGEDLVRLCAEAGVTVTSLPGACAGITALTLSALSTSRFVFEGFLPATGRERRERIAELCHERRTFILHEAPHRLRSTLSDLTAAFGGDRKIALCRELSKLNEEVLRLTLDRAVAYYNIKEPRGEYVLVIEGAAETASDAFWKDMTPAEHAAHYIALGVPERDAIKTAAEERHVSKNIVYNDYMKLKKANK